MTDYQRTIEFLKSLGLEELNLGPWEEDKEGFGADEESICIVPKFIQNKIIGDSWASFSFEFDADGRFKNINISGD